MPPDPPAPPLVLDTNIVLDLFVFTDPASAALRSAVVGGAVRWLATAAMREELARVLAYPLIAQRLARHGEHATTAATTTATAVLQAFDQHSHPVPVAPKAAYTCKDRDDQPFIDLAVAHRATLLSKDAHVLCMAKRLARLGVAVSRQWAPAGTSPHRPPHLLIATAP
jgi:predicted nucleic acid-binding protein